MAALMGSGYGQGDEQDQSGGGYDQQEPSLEERVESLEQRVSALEQEEEGEDASLHAAPKPKMSKRPAGGADAFMGG